MVFSPAKLYPWGVKITAVNVHIAGRGPCVIAIVSPDGRGPSDRSSNPGAQLSFPRVFNFWHCFIIFRRELFHGVYICPVCDDRMPYTRQYTYCSWSWRLQSLKSGLWSWCRPYYIYYVIYICYTCLICIKFAVCVYYIYWVCMCMHASVCVYVCTCVQAHASIGCHSDTVEGRGHHWVSSLPFSKDRTQVFRHGRQQEPLPLSYLDSPLLSTIWLFFLVNVAKGLSIVSIL